MAKTLKEVIKDFLKEKQGCVATLKEIYNAISDSDYASNGKTVDCSARAIIYRHEEEFTRIGKGIYMLKGEKSCSLLINGDSRNMEEIEDNSIDCIITDHPWSDKKAHTSGNQKGFAEYDTFSYNQNDFDNKARVLKNGSFLVEFLPVESATNWEYLSMIKQMAKKSGLEYYASCIWRKAPEGTINNGRTTKGVEQFVIFSKGKARRLAPKGKPYMTKNMLSFEVDIPIKVSDKNHQAEKPLALYKYLIENLTEEEEICLDQFGGACNMVKASIDLNRFGIVYELSKEFVAKAIKRFGMSKLFEISDSDIEETKEEMQTECEMSVLEIIPSDVTEFQKNFLCVLEKSSKKSLLSDCEWEKLSRENVEPNIINECFKKANNFGYANYPRAIFDIDFETYNQVKGYYDKIDKCFEELYSPYVAPYYENVRIENQCYAEYKVLHNGNVQQYLEYLKKNFPHVNIRRTERILTENCLVA